MWSKSIVFLAVIVDLVYGASKFSSKRNTHTIDQLNRDQVNYVANLEDIDHINTVLDNILIERVVGTEGHTKVNSYIKKELENYGFTVEEDDFQAQTPNMGTLTFKNIIGVLNPNAERFLVLACHYDSKYFENDVFLGATDSAVPCAMMLNLIKVLGNDLKKYKENNELSLKLLFLDGEEAFHTWSKTDSIYGARNLAKKYHSSRARSENGEHVSMLDRMDVFVLLDLLGTPQPSFYSYFRDTDRLYLVLSRAENALKELGQLRNHRDKYFVERAVNSYVEDDHIPFLKKGVPILHLIPSSFPDVWHKPSDNREAIDMDTVENLNKILRVFVTEYLHLQTFDKNNSEGLKVRPTNQEL